MKDTDFKVCGSSLGMSMPRPHIIPTDPRITLTYTGYVSPPPPPPLEKTPNNNTQNKWIAVLFHLTSLHNKCVWHNTNKFHRCAAEMKKTAPMNASDSTTTTANPSTWWSVCSSVKTVPSTCCICTTLNQNKKTKCQTQNTHLRLYTRGLQKTKTSCTTLSTLHNKTSTRTTLASFLEWWTLTELLHHGCRKFVRHVIIATRQTITTQWHPPSRLNAQTRWHLPWWTTLWQWHAFR